MDLIDHFSLEDNSSPHLFSVDLGGLDVDHSSEAHGGMDVDHSSEDLGGGKNIKAWKPRFFI